MDGPSWTSTHSRTWRTCSSRYVVLLKGGQIGWAKPKSPVGLGIVNTWHTNASRTCYKTAFLLSKVHLSLLIQKGERGILETKDKSRAACWEESTCILRAEGPTIRCTLLVPIERVEVVACQMVLPNSWTNFVEYTARQTCIRKTAGTACFTRLPEGSKQ